MNKTIVFAALVAMTALTAPPAKAKVFSQDDEQRFFEFSQRINHFVKDFAEDIINIGGRRPECLEDIATDADYLSTRINETYMLVSIAAAMRDSHDEEQVLIWLQSGDLPYAPTILANQRRRINLAMAICSGNGMAAVKGQELLRLHDEAGSWLAWISKKIGR
jgi:hypothetical protein